MIMRKLIITALAFLCIAGTSCKKSFLDINTNPNQVTEDQINSELILPSALHAAGNTVRMYTVLNKWMGYWSNSPTFNLQQDEVTYNVTTTFSSFTTLWNTYYDVLFDLNTIEKKSPEEGMPYYAGIAKVIKAKLFQDLVDCFGNVPYSEAFQKEIATPKYDKGSDIYANLQTVLDEAIVIFKANPTPGTAASNVDIVFKGNADLWIKLANTLKLKLLINQSEVTGFNPAAELAKITANGGVLMTRQSANVNPGYQNSSNQQSPYYAAYGYTVAGAEAGSNIRANTYLVNIYKNNDDPRLGRVFSPAIAPVNTADPYVGTVYGTPSSSTVQTQQYSYIGPGLAGTASQPQWIITSVESMFLFAEAVARGWLTGDARQAYENAVRESFIWLGVPNAVTAAETYMANHAIANWANAGSTVAQQAKFIGYQKYIAMGGFNPLEAWNLYRRLEILTANPPLSVHPDRLGNGSLPNRFLYPSAEYAVNAANVVAEGTINLFTSKVFWDK